MNRTTLNNLPRNLTAGILGRVNGANAHRFGMTSRNHRNVVRELRPRIEGNNMFRPERFLWTARPGELTAVLEQVPAGACVLLLPGDHGDVTAFNGVFLFGQPGASIRNAVFMGPGLTVLDGVTCSTVHASCNGTGRFRIQNCSIYPPENGTGISIRTRDSLILRNEILGGSVGIIILRPGCVIQENTISGFTFGIRQSSYDTSTIRNNVIVDNQYGVRTNGPACAGITNNDFMNNEIAIYTEHGYDITDVGPDNTFVGNDHIIHV